MLCPQRSNEPKAKQETTLQTKVSLAMNAQMHTGLKYEKHMKSFYFNFIKGLQPKYVTYILATLSSCISISKHRRFDEIFLKIGVQEISKVQKQSREIIER